MKKKSRKTITRELNRLWSLIVKERAGNRCEICGKTTGLNSHHIFGKKSQIKRFDIDNGICLCISHHTYGQVCAHSTSYDGQKEFHKILEEIRGVEFLEGLKQKYINPPKYTSSFLESMIEEYKEKLSQYEKLYS